MYVSQFELYLNWIRSQINKINVQSVIGFNIIIELKKCVCAKVIVVIAGFSVEDEGIKSRLLTVNSMYTG